ncbi:RusA family crossover junction endodeoxyribonuclease [Burkholderia glumae]
MKVSELSGALLDYWVARWELEGQLSRHERRRKAARQAQPRDAQGVPDAGRSRVWRAGKVAAWRLRLAQRGYRSMNMPSCAGNVVEALKDGMNGVVYVDDGQVVDLWVSKRYARAPGVRIEAIELNLQRA